MKIVINKCFGGFSLSPKAVKRMAELNGKECYFFKSFMGEGEYEEIKLEDTENSFLWVAFSVKHPKEHLPKCSRGDDGTYKDYNKAYKKIDLTNRPEDRTDPILIQVVEELGDEASDRYAGLEIIEVPNDVEYEIEEYAGLESIHEAHRSW